MFHVGDEGGGLPGERLGLEQEQIRTSPSSTMFGQLAYGRPGASEKEKHDSLFEVTVLLLSSATTIFKRLSKKAGAIHICYPICMLFFSFHIQKIPGHNFGKFQLKRLI
jgi:hypothetical protein